MRRALSLAKVVKRRYLRKGGKGFLVEVDLKRREGCYCFLNGLNVEVKWIKFFWATLKILPQASRLANPALA